MIWLSNFDVKGTNNKWPGLKSWVYLVQKVDFEVQPPLNFKD